MDDITFKMKVVSDLATLKSDVSHIKETMPKCRYDSVKVQLRNHKWMIYGLFALIIAPVIVTVIVNLGGKL